MAIQLYGGATAAVFAPLETLSRPDLIGRRLTDAIVLGLLGDAQQLPGETELAAMFGVSTVTIREALSELRRRQLIETRRGRGGGSFVRSPGAGATALVRERLLALSLVEVRDLGDHYAAIAGAAAGLASQRTSAADVQRLRRAAGMLAREHDPGARRRADAQFHLEVAVAAQSPRLYREEVALQGEFGALMWLTMDDDTHAGLVRHCEDLVGAVADRDRERAGGLAERRVSDATARIVEYRLAQEQ